MATIDLTTPEPDLIKVRLLARQLLDLVEPPDDDNGDEAPPPPSDAGQLARQVLGAETLAEARAFAQAVVDAEGGGDEPSAKRARRGKSPRARHEEAYTSLIVAVCELLAKEAGYVPLHLPALRFSAAEAHWANDPMAPTSWSVRPHLSFKSVLGSMDVSLLPKRVNRGTRTDSQETCNAVVALLGLGRELGLGRDDRAQWPASTNIGTRNQETEIPYEKSQYGPNVGLLLEPKYFAAIQRLVSDGVIGQAFFKACAAWAWALLKNEHNPEFPADE